MRRRHVTFATAALAASWCGSPALAQGRELPALVHRAGSLLSQSQRLGKSYALLGLGIEAADARRITNDCVAQSQQMAKAKEEFLAQMGVLQAAARTPAQKDAIHAANAQWVFFEAALQGSHLGADAGVHARLARASETMLLVMGEVAPKFARVG